MDKDQVLKYIKTYLQSLPKVGIDASAGVLFGSFARGTAHEWSDIDLLVLSPMFDVDYNLESVEKLWLATKYSDSRIEPIPCGVKEWEEDDTRPIIAFAKREGIVVSVNEDDNE